MTPGTGLEVGPPQPPARYPTVIRDVREVLLAGSAAAAPWVERLGREELLPLVSGDRVDVLLLAVSSRFMGKRFSEVSVSVPLAEPAPGRAGGGAFLAAAMSSVRFFAWVERRVFRAPYEHGRVELSVDEPLRFEAVGRSGTRVRAEAAPGARAAKSGEALWEGPLHLPRSLARPKDREGLFFFARLEGPATRIDFDADADRFVVEPAASDDGWGLLAASDFRPLAWQVRVGGVHARTKSYGRVVPPP